jgi:ABC-2 type transport system ATP-binding protein
MTGLDPIGRKEIRDLILELRAEGKTVFFSTHILPDVETTCDRVAMVVAGRLRNVGPLSELLSARLLATEVVLRSGGGDLSSASISAQQGVGLPPLPEGTRRLSGREGAPGGVVLEMPAGIDVDRFLGAALARGANIVSVTPRRESLEDLFVREAAAREAPGASP